MFTLENQQIVIAGDLAQVDAEDAKWKLIERGARVMASVTKSTALVVLGGAPKKNVLAGVEKHRTPTTDEAGLLRLMAGATIAEVLREPSAASTARHASARPLDGRRVAFDGAFRGHTKATTKTRLEALGATVQSKPSPKAELLVLGERPGFDALDALDAGVPSIDAEAIDALEAGAPLTDFVAARVPLVGDPEAVCARAIEGARASLLAIDLGGERWEDELRVTVHPDGRLAVKLRELGGTPTEEHVRRVLLRAPWPAVTSPVTMSVPLVFG